ncbi:MAG: cobalamin-dependent protein, partial [Thermodesulfobacteriota bacterium]|nr:cobalamin-dependent protein [Thermodesulfobacteriota bacterium]
MLDLLLIFPPLSSKLSYGSYEQFKSIDIGNYPPLGLLYIGAYIKKYSNYEVKVLDAHCEKMNYNSLYYEIQNCQPKAVGIYTSSFTFYDSYEVAKIVKKVDKKIKVILGGPHIEIYPEESLSLKEVDIVVIGEGEIPVLEILDVFHNKKNFSDIQSIGCKVNGESFFTRPPSVDLDLDKKPFPDRTLTNYKKY